MNGTIRITRRTTGIFISGVLACFMVAFALTTIILDVDDQPAILTDTVIRDHQSSVVFNSPTSWTCTVRSGTSASGTGARTSTVSCLGNEKVVSGGCYLEYNSGAHGEIDQHYSRPSDQGWECQARHISGASVTVDSWANCCT